MKTTFVFGQTRSFDSLPANSIALDGAVQAPRLDPANRRYSFDHHDGCTRFATLATCQQVALAIRMGLVVDGETEVFVNDLDADTMVSLWLLEHPDRVNDPKVVELVEQVGRMDAHFMGPAHPLHFMLMPPRGSVQTEEMLSGFLTTLDKWYDGSLELPPRRTQPGKAFGWRPETGWVDIGEVTDGFQSVYDAGYLAGVVYSPAPEDSMLYTVGRRSDFVPLAVGPSHVNRQADAASYRNDTILGQLAQAEIEKNPAQEHGTNWGGASTVGGSCRNTGNVASRLTPEEVLAVCQSFER